jgi:DNA-binding NtrC family response regulator
VAGLLWPEVLAMLKEHDGSGNVCELANAMERVIMLAGSGPITPAHLQPVRRPGTMPVQTGLIAILLSPHSAVAEHPGTAAGLFPTLAAPLADDGTPALAGPVRCF